MPSYYEWNDAIAEYFFNDGNEGRKVYLSITREIILDIGFTIDVEAAEALGDFLDAVRREVRRCTPNGNICDAAAKLLWAGRRNATGWQTYPDYVAMLSACTLPVTDADSLIGHNYYDPLSQLLKPEYCRGLFSSYQQHLDNIWRDFGRWANVSLRGSLGILDVRTFSFHHYVGYFFLQGLYRQSDCRKLAALLVQKGIAGGEHISKSDLRQIILNDQAQLGKRVEALAGYAEQFDAFVEAAYSWYRTWDGTISGAIAQVRRSIYRLVPCLQYDEVQKKLRCTFRMKGFRGATQELEFRDAQGVKYYVQGQADRIHTTEMRARGQFSPLVTFEDIPLTHAKTFTAGNGRTILYEGSPCVIFEQGSRYGLPGEWVAISRPRANEPLRVLCHRSECSHLEEILADYGTKLRMLKVVNAVDWYLYDVEGIGIDALGQSPYLDIRVSLADLSLNIRGIRAQAQTQTHFLDCCPPKIHVEAAEVGIQVNGEDLPYNGMYRAYVIDREMGTQQEPAIQRHLTVGIWREDKHISDMKLSLCMLPKMVKVSVPDRCTGAYAMDGRIDGLHGASVLDDQYYWPQLGDCGDKPERDEKLLTVLAHRGRMRKREFFAALANLYFHEFGADSAQLELVDGYLKNHILNTFYALGHLEIDGDYVVSCPPVLVHPWSTGAHEVFLAGARTPSFRHAVGAACARNGVTVVPEVCPDWDGISHLFVPRRYQLRYTNDQQLYRVQDALGIGLCDTSRSMSDLIRTHPQLFGSNDLEWVPFEGFYGTQPIQLPGQWRGQGVDYSLHKVESRDQTGFTYQLSYWLCRPRASGGLVGTRIERHLGQDIVMSNRDKPLLFYGQLHGGSMALCTPYIYMPALPVHKMLVLASGKAPICRVLPNQDQFPYRKILIYHDVPSDMISHVERLTGRSVRRL